MRTHRNQLVLRFPIALALSLVFSAPGPVFAAETGEEDWVAIGSDPSEIVSRLEFRNEYLDEGEDGFQNITTLRGDWAPGDRWQLRLDLPLVGADLDEFGSAYGFGDLYLSGRGALPIAERWSLVGELGFTLPSASDEALGTGKAQIMPLVAPVWKPSPAWILALSYQWLGSFAGDPDREDISESDARFQTLLHLPQGFWLLSDNNMYVNHEDDNRVAFYPEGEFGKVVAQHVESWIRAGGKAAGEGSPEREGWKVEVGVRYLFH